MVKINIAIKNDKFVHIDEVKKGEQDCKCSTCSEPLIVREGEKNTKHFSHKIECDWDNETALHKLGIQILLNNTKIKLPNNKTIEYSEPKKEQVLLNSQRRSDVSAICQDGSNIHFEIFVTHEVDQFKKSLYINNKEKSVEIDLYKHLTSTFKEIENAVIQNLDNKYIIYWPKEKFKIRDLAVKVLLFLSVIFVGFKILKSLSK